MSVFSDKEFHSFCASEDERGRYDITSPFIHQQKQYATNGRIAIRRPALGMPNSKREFLPESLFKSIRDMFVQHKSKVAFVDIGSQDQRETCSYCYGRGRQTETCSQCDGDGSCQCITCDHIHECGMCSGNGDTFTMDPCNTCKGSGILVFHSDQYIGNRYFRGEYLSKISTLPNLQLSAVHVTDKDCPMYFTFDGGEGLLMSSTPPE